MVAVPGAMPRTRTSPRRTTAAATAVSEDSTANERVSPSGSEKYLEGFRMICPPEATPWSPILRSVRGARFGTRTVKFASTSRLAGSVAMTVISTPPFAIARRVSPLPATPTDTTDESDDQALKVRESPSGSAKWSNRLISISSPTSRRR